VGVAPFARESGKHRGRRAVRGGRRDLRHGLYEAVTTTIRCDPSFGAHYRRLQASGKPHRVAMVACKRRLLGILNAMIRDGLTWPETQVGQGRFLVASP
jgi:transposase